MGIAIPQVVSKSTTSGSGAQVIDGSLQITSAAYNSGPHLTRTPGSAGNRRTWTWAGWVKRNKFDTGNNQEHALFVTSDSNGNSDYVTLYFNDSGYLNTTAFQGGSTQWSLKTSQIFRDSGWMHIVWAVDLSQSTSSDRVKLYVNGSQITSFSTETYPSSAFDTRMNSTNEHSIGRASLYNRWHATIGLSQVYLIDGQQLTPESFGFTDPLTNTWKPKKYTGAFTATIPGKSESDSYAASGRFTSYETFGTVTENDTGYTLPSSSWSHYGGKVKELDTGGFKITTVNSASEDFFMGCWVKFETYATDRQIGIDNFGDYVYWETQANGAIGIRHNGGSRQDSSATSLNDGNWHHIALSRTGDTLYGFVDGTAVISTTSGVSNGTNSVQANENFWFFGGSGTAYNIDGQVIDPFVYIGQGLSSYTTPSSPLIDSSGDVNQLFGINNSTYLYYASPGIDLGLSGGTAGNSFYLPMDGNSPIGQDKSGRGNDFTPVNFGGSVALDSPAVSGARPFLNTTQGGTQATVGVFGSRENVGYAVTVYNDGGGNKYYIDGVKQDTVTGLIRGATYTFDTSDSTVSSHPFRFSATSNGSHGGGSEYTNGVAAITGAATTITVPHDAPNTLYYYCTSHSGMGADITGITTNEKLADQYASNCVLAVSFSGGRYQDDSSLLNCTTAYNSVSSEGNINSGISTISNFYATSLYFDGSGDYYTTPGSNTSELGMGTGDFTIETWIYPTALGTDFIVNLTAADSVFGYNSDGTLNIQLPSSGAPALTQKGPKIVANKWNHFAVVRESGAVRGYIDGVLAATVTDTTNMGSTGKAVIGSHATLSREITGYLQDLRIYKGIAKYTSDFVVPATSPDVLPDTPSGVSGSSKLAKIIDGAVRFDGTGDLLSVPDSDDFHLGTNDFTIEYFVYKNSTQGTNSHHVSQYGTSNANRSFAFRSVALPFTDLQFRWYNGSNEYTMNWSEGWMRAQEGWKHICVQRKSGVMYLYIDGKLWKIESGSSAALSINNSTAPLTIGGDSNTGSEYYLNGSISNFRFINGTAIYRTGGFVPPAEPLTNVTNTKLLCCQSNTSATEAAVIPTGSITANGDAAATNFNPFNTDINTVRGQETGYCTFNPLKKSSEITLSNGNLNLSSSNTSNKCKVFGTFSVSTGKYYYEVTIGTNHRGAFGWATTQDSNLAQQPGDSTGDYALTFDGNKISSGSYTAGYGSSFAAGTVIGVRLDADAGNIAFSIDGIDLGNAFTGQTGKTFWPIAGDASSGGTIDASVNFGQKPFKFPPPDGFQPLNTANTRPVKVISRPDQYVGVTTYKGTGDSVSPRTVELPFAADLVWAKSRDRSSYHMLVDTVRGNNKVISSNDTDQERDPTSYFSGGGVASIDGKIISIESGSSNNANLNTNNEDAVVWSWKAGGSKGTFNKDDVGYASAAAAGLDDGSINPSGASVGTEQGFSIIKFASGSSGVKTLSHGLLETPTFALVKTTGATSDWSVYHKDIGGVNNYLVLNANTANATATEIWGSSLWTSSVFGIKSGTTCATNQDVIAYLWHDVPGLQKFGVYEGNNNSDGPFVELGFRPSIVWTKNVDDSQDWTVYDNKRDTFNPATKVLVQNSTSAGNANDAFVGSYPIDFLSNGFKIRNTTPETNAAQSYIYCAWADVPTVDLYGGGANAR